MEKIYYKLFWGRAVAETAILQAHSELAKIFWRAMPRPYKEEQDCFYWADKVRSELKTKDTVAAVFRHGSNKVLKLRFSTKRH